MISTYNTIATYRTTNFIDGPLTPCAFQQPLTYMCIDSPLTTSVSVAPEPHMYH